MYVCTYPVIAYCASWEEPNAIILAVSQTRVFEKQIFKLFKLQKKLREINFPYYCYASLWTKKLWNFVKNSHLKNITWNQQIFSVKSTFLQKKLFTNKMISRNFLCVIHSAVPHCGNCGNLLSLKKIFRQITYLVISLVKLLLSRNFCQKCVRVNFRNFLCVGNSKCSVWKNEKFGLTKKYIVKSTL